MCAGPRSARTRGQRSGARAEEAVARYLLDRGFQILGRNVRVGRYEIDLLARAADMIVIVEVRERGPNSFQAPLESIDAGKQARLRAAAERLWSERFADDRSVNLVRFDVAGVVFGPGAEPQIEYVEAAFF